MKVDKNIRDNLEVLIEAAACTDDQAGVNDVLWILARYAYTHGRVDLRELIHDLHKYYNGGT